MKTWICMGFFEIATFAYQSVWICMNDYDRSDRLNLQIGDFLPWLTSTQGCQMFSARDLDGREGSNLFWSTLEVWIFHVSTAWFIVYVGFSQMAAPQFLLVYNGKSYYNGWFWDSPIWGNLHVLMYYNSLIDNSIYSRLLARSPMIDILPGPKTRKAKVPGRFHSLKIWRYLKSVFVGQ